MRNVQPFPDRITDRVLDLASLPTIVAGFQEDRPTVGTGMGLVELHHHGAAKQVWEQNTLCWAIPAHAKASRVVERPVVKPYYHERGFCLSGIANFPG
jgi:hypothetical protein